MNASGVVRAGVERVGDRPRAELGHLVAAATSYWRLGRRPWLAVCAVVLAVCATAADRHPTRHLLLLAGGVRADLGWWTEVARLPVSAFLPTPELPLAAAAAQLVLVLGLGQLLLGWRGTLLVAALGQLVSSLAARLMILASAFAVIGLPASQAGILDTGPSGMTTAVGAWLLARCRCYLWLAALGGALVIAAALQDNLDGREHLVAFLVGLGAALGSFTPVGG